MCDYRFLAQQDLAQLLFKTQRSHQIEPNEQWLPLMVNGCLDLKLHLNKCEASTKTLLPSQNSFSDLLRGNWVQSSSGVQIILSSQKETQTVIGPYTSLGPRRQTNSRHLLSNYNRRCILIIICNLDFFHTSKLLK